MPCPSRTSWRRTNLALPMSPTLDAERAAEVVSVLAELTG